MLGFGTRAASGGTCCALQRPLSRVTFWPTAAPYTADQLVVYIVEYPPWTPLAEVSAPVAVGAQPNNKITPGMPWCATLQSKQGLLPSKPVPQLIQNTYLGAKRIRELDFLTLGGSPSSDGIATITISAKATSACAGGANASITFCYAWCAQPFTLDCTPSICGTPVAPVRITEKQHCGMSFRQLAFVRQASPLTSYLVLELAQDCTAPGVDLYTLCDAPCVQSCNTCVDGTVLEKEFIPGTNTYQYVQPHEDA